MGRVQSESRSTKREPFLKFSEDCEKILRVLEEEGPCGYSELVRKTKIPRGTINWRLRHLKRIRNIKSVKRKWMLVAHAVTFKNLYEYEIHLRHSMELVKGILAINEFLPQFVPRNDFYAGDILTEQRKKLKLHSSLEMWPYVLQHIKTGYSNIFTLLKRCESLLDAVQDVEVAISEETLEKLAREIPNIKSTDINQDLSAGWENNMDEKSEFTIVPTEEERFKLEEQTAEARSALENQLTELILKVVNGEPLSGKCDRCPKVDIREKSVPIKEI